MGARHPPPTAWSGGANAMPVRFAQLPFKPSRLIVVDQRWYSLAI
jgi:hypothetical protein